MIFAKIVNDAVADYPLSEQAIRLAYPTTALPKNVLDSDLVLADGYVAVQEIDKPAYNPETEVLTELSPAYVNGSWQQDFAIEAISAEAINAKYQQLAEHQIVQKLDETARLYSYDNMLEAGIYASTVNPYQLEAQSIIEWAANCWVLFYAETVFSANWADTLPEFSA